MTIMTTTVLNEDEDEVMNDDNDEVMNDDNDDGVVKKLDDLGLDDDDDDLELDEDDDHDIEGLKKMIKRVNEVCFKRLGKQNVELYRVRVVSAFLMGPLISELQRYCRWYACVGQIVFILERYAKQVCKALNSYYMKICGTLAPLPINNVDYEEMVNNYKAKFEQQHLEAVERAKRGQLVEQKPEQKK
ncbi:hypothetical protein ABFX02_11G111900 [Erythranthe guttata]